MDQAPAIDVVMASARRSVAEADAFAVVELLDGHDPAVAAEAYDRLQRESYWERKDVPAVVALSRAGIHHGLTAARRCDDPERARGLRGGAKTLAYNLASFTWPGWDEPGIMLTASDVAVGLDAARLNLRLAEELGRPAKVRADALWLLGAHRLAAEDHRAAAEHFGAGQKLAAGSGERLLGRLFDGYLRLTRLLAEPENVVARREFDAAVAELKADADEDARAHGDQLLTALAVFRPGGGER